MKGALYTRASVEGWLRDGAQLERIVLPPEVLPVGTISAGGAARRLTSSTPCRSRYDDVEPVSDWAAYLQGFRRRWSGGDVPQSWACG
jgi:hypothetical protein